jgi:aconitate hydratase
MAYKLLRAHDVAGAQATAREQLHIRFDALISHDITYVGIIQTARASGLEQFPVPYALTNCHNSLCAVGGTINEDDHAFGLSAAQKYGGIYVPANQAVIHQFAREQLVGVGKMILGSDSHTRYGCFGTMGFGEGGGELVKQLLENTYDIAPPEVVLVWLEGTVPHGIGPHDVALALVAQTFVDGRVKNKILEFAGPGVAELPMDFRCGIDVMTTETSALSSIWITDEVVRDYYRMVGRSEDFATLEPDTVCYYDSIVRVNLGAMESMIALPFHPSKAYSIHELQRDPQGILAQIEQAANVELGGQVTLDLLSHIDSDGKIQCDQGVIVGCAGGMYDNLVEAAAILDGKSVGAGYFNLSVYPSSAPVNLAITKDGTAATLIEAGAVVKPAFCGPCFGAGDTPATGGLSVRHATRNFANREGAKPGAGQVAAVALMDARSIAATAAAGGVLTAATDIAYVAKQRPLTYDASLYEKRCYFGFGQARPEVVLRFGPNIVDWPRMAALGEHLLLELAAVIHDPVTTTDELIPSGETSSYRSNPLALAEFTLSRREPAYVERSKNTAEKEAARLAGTLPKALAPLLERLGALAEETTIGSALFATKPGDGSAREQAASCQKVLGGWGNIAYEYATKRYRSNCINWGILPFTIDAATPFDYEHGDFVFVPDVRAGVLAGVEQFAAKVVSGDAVVDVTLHLAGLNSTERQILADGCLMNYYANAKRR